MSSRDPKKRHWVCPEGKHPGKLGPKNPRLDDVVRFCFPCSETSGRLVPRICPANDKARAEKKETASRRKQRTKAAKDERQRRKWTFGNHDLRVESKLLLKHVGLKPSEVSIELRARRKGSYVTGRSFGGRVVLTIPPSAPASVALALLCHEIAHEGVKGDGHGDRWRSAFVELAEVYGASIEGAYGSSHDLHTAIQYALVLALGEDSSCVVPGAA